MQEEMEGSKAKGIFVSRQIMAWMGIFFIFVVFVTVLLSGTTSDGVPQISLSIRAEFFLFAITLLGVAVFHNNTLLVSMVGLGSIVTMKILFDKNFSFVEHMNHEVQTLVNLLGLLLGFAILSKNFEESKIPENLPKLLPNGWLGGFVLLACVFILSGFLDNIAAAMIGGSIALVVFKGKVDIGYLAAIVASSNAGGAGSVIGDTTTTMMWIEGVSAKEVIHAYLPSAVAFTIFAPICSLRQQNYQAIQKDNIGHHKILKQPLIVVVLILVGAITANTYLSFPAVGVWAGIIIGTFIYRTPWAALSLEVWKGSFFLLTLVTAASMMPVEELPTPSPTSTFVLGLISAVFDNIPLTKLALEQGNYDWPLLAFSVGFGGSMIWFGSSAGVALSNSFPQAKNVTAWLQYGWSIPIGYIFGFLAYYLTFGWNPSAL